LSGGSRKTSNMQGDLCRIKAFKQNGKFRFHRLAGTKLQQFRDSSDATPIREVTSPSDISPGTSGPGISRSGRRWCGGAKRAPGPRLARSFDPARSNLPPAHRVVEGQVDVRESFVSFLHKPSDSSSVQSGTSGTGGSREPTQFFKIAFKDAKLELEAASEDECKLWVQAIMAAGIGGEPPSSGSWRRPSVTNSQATEPGAPASPLGRTGSPLPSGAAAPQPSPAQPSPAPLTNAPPPSPEEYVRPVAAVPPVVQPEPVPVTQPAPSQSYATQNAAASGAHPAPDPPGDGTMPRSSSPIDDVSAPPSRPPAPPGSRTARPRARACRGCQRHGPHASRPRGSCSDARS